VDYRLNRFGIFHFTNLHKIVYTPFSRAQEVKNVVLEFIHVVRTFIIAVPKFIVDALNYIIAAPTSIAAALKYKLKVNFAIIYVKKFIVVVPNSDYGFFFAGP